ncbi:MAG: hypothetical protein HOV83_14780 [Catenulispora sp.]|nr:hypothetical protein [Catenulispora sp.]
MAVVMSLPSGGANGFAHVDRITGPIITDAGSLALPDGTLLGHDMGVPTVLRPGQQAPAAARPPAGVEPTSAGYALAPDGTVYLGWDGGLFAAHSPDLADLKPISSLPSTFGERVRPLGTRPDGSVVVLDGETVWTLRDGRLTRILRVADIPASVLEPGDQATGIATGTVAADGTIWLVVQAKRGPEQAQWLADVIGLTPSGQVTRLTVPATATGFNGDPRRLEVSSLTPDGSGVLYIRVAMGHSPNQYVIRLTAESRMPQHATVVAASTLRPEDQDAQHPKFPKQADALSLPWYLPSGIAVRPGMIVLSGGTNYVLAVGIG